MGLGLFTNRAAVLQSRSPRGLRAPMLGYGFECCRSQGCKEQEVEFGCEEIRWYRRQWKFRGCMLTLIFGEGRDRDEKFERKSGGN